MLNLILISSFVVFVIVLFYRVELKERYERISEKRRLNRIEFQRYKNLMEIKQYMKSRYNIDYDVEDEVRKCR